MGSEKLQEFNDNGDLDSSIGLDGLSRLRVNAYITNNKRCLTLNSSRQFARLAKFRIPKEFINLASKNRVWYCVLALLDRVSQLPWLHL